MILTLILIYNDIKNRNQKSRSIKETEIYDVFFSTEMTAINRRLFKNLNDLLLKLWLNHPSL